LIHFYKRRMLFKAFLLGLLLFGWNYTAIFLLSFNLSFTTFGQRIFAIFLSNFVEVYNSVAHPLKTKLFSELNEIKSDDKVKILEIGGGSGANFKYYNISAEVDTVEPNASFFPIFNENKSKFKSLQINDAKQGYGEDLREAGIPDNSVDVVVMTLVLCSVTSQKKCIKEIQRVLKPGGKFFFMEHILANEGDNLRYLQMVLTQAGFWQFMFDGCCLDRDTPRTIEEMGGWSKLEQTKYDLPEPEEGGVFKFLRNFVRPHVMGVAVK